MRREKIILYLMAAGYAAVGSCGVYRCAAPLLSAWYDGRAVYGIVPAVLVPLIFFYDVIKSKCGIGSFIILGVSISYSFLVGSTPDSVGFFLAVCYLLALTMMKRIKDVKIRVKAGGIALLAGAAAVGGGLLLRPALEAGFDHKLQVREEIQSVFQNFPSDLSFFTSGNGGVSNGNLSGISEFTGGTETQLIVRTHSPHDFYLQGFIGGDYKKNKWKTAGNLGFELWRIRSDLSKMEIKNELYDNGRESYGKFRSVVEIENVAANTGYQYMPYGAYYTKQDAIVADTYVKGKGRVWQTDYIAGREYEMLYLANGGESGTAYEQYVRDTYLQVPDHIRKSFSEAAQEKKGQSIADGVEEVKNQLRSRTEYDVKPGAAPVGEDFAEYFFFENRKGFCMHYATTAVLMLRLKGIPARFVSGYKIGAWDFEESELGMYEAKVTGNHAHAWAEIYVGDLGWIPVEVTPPYYQRVTVDEELPEGSDPPEAERTENAEPQENQKQREEDGEAQNQEAQKEASDSGREGGGEAKNVWEINSLALRVVWIVAGAAVLLLFLALQSTIRRKKRLGYGLKDNRKKVQRLFVSIYQLLVCAGMKELSAELEDEFAEEAFRICPEVSKETWEEALSLALSANYGRGKMGREQSLFMRRVYMQAKKSVWKNMKTYRKLYVKYVKSF